MLKLKYDFIGTVFGILASLLIALNLGDKFMIYAFISYIISDLAYMKFAIEVKSKSLFWLNLIWLVINIVALIRWS
jgi:hypothetical protein